MSLTTLPILPLEVIGDRLLIASYLNFLSLVMVIMVVIMVRHRGHYDLTLEGDRLLPRLLLPGQLVHLHLLPGSLATQATDCERGELLSGWIQSIL